MTGINDASTDASASTARRRYWRWAVLPVAAAGLVIAAEAFLSKPHAPAASAAVRLPRAGFGPAAFAEAWQNSDEQLALGRERVRGGAGEWLRQESLARALIVRSRLSGSYDELAEADAVMERARGLAPAGGGPLLTDASLAMLTHRLPRAERALAALSRSAVPPDAGERAEAAALTGDIAFYRGDFAGARRAYAQAAGIGTDGGIAFRTAALAKAGGDFDGAIRDFRASLSQARTPTPLQVASIALQIGAVELARGNRTEADRRFHEADRIFPGFWLFEAHVAQGLALAGDLPGAIVRMRQIARRSGSAEVMDALAMLLRANGEATESRQWAAAAGKVWERRLAQLPEAAYGHAVEHELVFGTPVRALDLAQRNLAARPYGESRLLLANALVLNGRIPEALEQLRLAEASGWRSAPLYALRAEALSLTGQQKAAETARERAMALNPHIFEPHTPIVWFSHG